MDQELDRRLANIEKMVSDNNRMLSKMRSAQKNALYWKLLYWTIIIGLTVASFYLIQPYIKQFGAAYGLGGDDTTSSTQSSTSQLLELVKQYQAGQKTTE